MTHSRSWARLVPCVLALLASIGVEANADIQVVKLRRKSTTKISDTIKEFSYEVAAFNNGAQATGVTAVATSYDSQVSVVSRDLQFPDMATGAIAKSINQFAIRVPKGHRLNKALLRVDFSATSTPVANAGTDQVRGVGAQAQLNGGGSYDPFGKPLTYTWSLQSAPGGSSAALVDANTALARFTPDIAGDYVFSLAVSNGTNTSSPSTTTVSTDSVRPIANAGRDQTVKKKAVVELDGTASTSPMERPLTYAWQILSKPEDSEAILSDPNALRPTFVADRKGTYRVQLSVSDGSLTSAPSVVTVVRGKRKTNTPPQADAGTDLSAFGPTLPVLLRGGRSTDAEGDFLTYRWFVLGRPDGTVAVPEANNPDPIFRVDGAGIWHLQVNVSDGKSESIATMLINTDNDIAQTTGGYAARNPSDPSQFLLDYDHYSTLTNYIEGEPETKIASWSLLSAPMGSSASVAPGMLQTDVDGDYAVQLKVQDRGSATSLQGVGITRGAARPIAVIDPASSTPLVGSPVHFIDWVPGLVVTFDGSHSYDHNGLPLSYHWTLIHRPATSNAAFTDPSAASPTLSLDVDGSYVAQLVVNNGVRDSLPVTGTLVNYVNEPPTPMDLFTTGPWQSPCIPLTLRAIDRESVPGSVFPGVVFRRINSTINGVLKDFIGPGPEGTAVLCYVPRRFYTGFDQFSFEAYDQGFPWGCGDEAPGCRAGKTGGPAYGNIQVFEVVSPPF